MNKLITYSTSKFPNGRRVMVTKVRNYMEQITEDHRLLSRHDGDSYFFELPGGTFCTVTLAKDPDEQKAAVPAEQIEVASYASLWLATKTEVRDFLSEKDGKHRRKGFRLAATKYELRVSSKLDELARI
ncbi:MAG: hypothetical protein ACHQX1_01615 [Candidatus Micrarchaeales archaeon]